MVAVSVFIGHTLLIAFLSLHTLHCFLTSSICVLVVPTCDMNSDTKNAMAIHAFNTENSILRDSFKVLTVKYDLVQNSNT